LVPGHLGGAVNSWWQFALPLTVAGEPEQEVNDFITFLEDTYASVGIGACVWGVFVMK